MENQNGLVSFVNGTPVVSSRDIAEKFEKRHADILEKISQFELDIQPTENSVRYFIKSDYIDFKGESRKEYLITRDGFSLLVMGFTGKKALEWKIRYIDAFNKMETTLKTIDPRANILLSIYKGGQDAIAASRQLVEIETRPLLEKIEEDKPFRDFAEHVGESNDTIDIGVLAKLAQDEQINIGRNRLFDFLRGKQVLMPNNIPYQRYIDNKWFEVVEIIKQTPYGSKIFPKTVVTGKGQIGVIEMLRKEFKRTEQKQLEGGKF